MKNYRSIFFASVLFVIAIQFMLGCLLTTGLQHAHASVARQQQQIKKYKLYCVNGKLEIGIRSPEDMQRARGDQVCLIDSYVRLTQAKEASKRYGGVGSHCPCSPSGNQR
ncbi:MAG: hypothetical protein M3Q91_18765 [Acidobacteriota bacterium]|nr:hypothetical protein [Acidobacteriota bacterium]